MSKKRQIKKKFLKIKIRKRENCDASFSGEMQKSEIKGEQKGERKKGKKLEKKIWFRSEMGTKPKSKKEKKEEDDPRSMPTKINLAKNKMRAMGLNMGYKHDQGLVDAYQKVYQNGEQQIDEILEKGARGKIDFNTGKQTTDTGKKTKEGYPISQEKQVMKTKRVTVNNPKGRKRNQSPAGKTIGKLQQVKQKQYDAERKGDRKSCR
ncbi:MAG: hypothetical protein CM15mL4_0110 [uncultured marine virus]|nr:MAG: hypothetical protein CM15mL4_0110 [uncultured marine virus]